MSSPRCRRSRSAWSSPSGRCARSSADAELPPKIGDPSRGPTARSPMRCRRTSAGPGRRRADLRGHEVGVGLPGEQRRGLPAINAVVVLNDPATGAADRDPRRRADHRPADGGGQRRRDRGTCARRRGRPDAAGRRSSAPASRAAATCRSSATSLPGVEVAIYDRHPERAEALVAEARRDRRASARRSRRRRAPATRSTAPTSSSRSRRSRRRPRQMMTIDWLAPDALVVAGRLRHDLRRRGRRATRRSSSSTIAASSSPTATRASSTAIPDPAATIGEALLAGTPRPHGSGPGDATSGSAWPTSSSATRSWRPRPRPDGGSSSRADRAVPRTSAGPPRLGGGPGAT